jgi:hypothetical protein
MHARNTRPQYAPGSSGYDDLARACWDHEGGEECTVPAGRLFYLALPPFVYPQASSCGGGRRESCCSCWLLQT